MNTTDLRTGDGWLKAVADVATPLESLEAALHAWQAEGKVLAPYAVTEMVPAPQPKKAHWTAQYFFRQVSHAKHNFSGERARHLLLVRAYLEQLGVAGFVKQAAMTPLAKDEASAAVVVAAFSPSPSLVRALGTGDAGIIRSALVLELADARLSGAYLQAAMALAADQHSPVFLPFEEGRFKGPLNGDRDAWSAQYHDNQIVFLDANFSIERFLHVVDVRDHLRTQGVTGFVPADSGQGAAYPKSVTPSKAGGTPASSQNGGPRSSSAADSWVLRIAARLVAAFASLADYFTRERR